MGWGWREASVAVLRQAAGAGTVAPWGGLRARAAHLLEKQWAADTTQQVCTRLPAQKLLPM